MHQGAAFRHKNPVYLNYFADPFVWAHKGLYYAVGTGEFEAAGLTVGRVFPMLHSMDFLHWRFVRSALMRPDRSLGDSFWAPEVAFFEGKFYMYYSVGFADKQHRLRVAIAEKPLGPYTDAGVDLLDPAGCPFAIDAHPFRDYDGKWYLFYACDFLDTTPPYRVGTGLKVAPMKSMTELESGGTMVMRARSDWQRFETERPMYGGTWDWHTVEGPAVVRHSGKYYCFYSGGRWENDSYGVDYCVADNVMGPYSDEGNESGPRVLQTLKGKLIGPGHNSLVTGPDNRPYIVYHAWDVDMKARRMCISPLRWTPDGPRAEPAG